MLTCARLGEHWRKGERVHRKFCLPASGVRRGWGRGGRQAISLTLHRVPLLLLALLFIVKVMEEREEEGEGEVEGQGEGKGEGCMD